MNYEQQYLELMQRILDTGEFTQDRTGTGVYSVFGATMTHDLQQGFPLLTTKKINFSLIAGELLWFLSGKNDLDSLRHYQNKPKYSHTIWSDDFEKYWQTTHRKDEIKNKEGGRIYGKQLRSYAVDYGTHDQLATLIENIKAVKADPNHPMARRLICSFWNPYDHTVGDKKWCALPACHTDFQCIVRGNKLHLRYSMRSNDTFLGQPFNEASYGLLCHILAKLTGLEIGNLLYFGTDVHIYSNHVEQCRIQLGREIRSMPKLVLPQFETLDDLLKLTGQDFTIKEYNPHAFIKAKQSS